MSDASTNTSQQFQNGGVIPADLVGQNAVNKTYVDQQDAAIQQSVNTVSTSLAQHKVGTNNEHLIATNQYAGFMSVDDKTKMDTVSFNAQKNQNAFSAVNNIGAKKEADTLTIQAGTGITVSTEPTTNKLTITATGTAAPGPHASTHLPGGADELFSQFTIDAWNNAEQRAKNYADQNFVKVIGTQLIELGLVGSNTAQPALIDFHSGATYADFDFRIISTGGQGFNGGADVEFIGYTIKFTTAAGEIRMANLYGMLSGNGNPEGAINAIPGSVYRNMLGGANNTFFVKESGNGNTGWKAK